jgi:cob(I)alamin adenosyltransferase
MTAGDDSPRTDPLAHPDPVQPQTARKAPVPKKKRPGPYRVPPREQRHGLLIVNTGDGKGKTTAALGLLLRASGRGMRVGMFQFVKNMRNNGEHRTAQRLGMEIVALGAGCTLGHDDTTDDETLAIAGWAHCAALVAAGEYDVLVLDELTLPMAWGWLDVEAVVAALVGRPKGTHVVVTGRHAPPELVAAADLVTDMRVIKHPFEQRRVRAQAGIDV